MDLVLREQPWYRIGMKGSDEGPPRATQAPETRRSCPVCGSGQSADYARKGELRLARCARCSMVFLDPVPAAYASGAFYNTTAAGYYLSPAKLESDYAPVRFERELRIFRKFCQTGAVLDVGCSSGAFLYQLNRRFAGCYDVVGTDASGPALDYAKSRGLCVARGDFLLQDFGGRKFDAVSFWAVLEHLAQPKSFLEHAFLLLKPGGVCFALVPNLQSLASRLLRTWYRYVYPQHLNYFTRATMSRLAETQFEIVQIFSTHFNPVVIWQDWRGGGKEVANEDRAELLKRTTAFKENPLLGPLKALYRAAEAGLGALNLADNLVFILRKPAGNAGNREPLG